MHKRSQLTLRSKSHAGGTITGGTETRAEAARPPKRQYGEAQRFAPPHLLLVSVVIQCPTIATGNTPMVDAASSSCSSTFMSNQLY